MAVDFSLLPNETPEPDKPPSRPGWALVFLLLVLIGVVAVLLAWPKGQPTQTSAFWGTVILFPVGIAALIVLLRFQHYHARKLDVQLGNTMIRQYNERVFATASVPLAVLGASYRFSVAPDENAIASVQSGALRLAVREMFAQDSEPEKVRWLDVPSVKLRLGTEEDDRKRQIEVTRWLFAEMIAELAGAIKTVSAQAILKVNLLISGLLTAEQNEALWKACWSGFGLRQALVFEPAAQTGSLQMIDAWLDRIRTMKKLQIDLLVVLVLALLVTGAVLIWGEALGLTTPDARGVALIGVAVGALFIALVVSFDGLTRWSGAARRLKKCLHLNQAAMQGTTQASVSAVPEKRNAAGTLNPLHRVLRERNGLRWRFRQSWLLLVGQEAVVTRLLPELTKSGWSIKDGVVLLWGEVSSDGQIDEQRLREIRRMRRGRPVDAIVLAIDGAVPLPTASGGGTGWGTTLAGIARKSRWSAPIYLLDLDGSDSARAVTPVMGCEFVDSGDQAAIEAALLTLRDRLADLGAKRIGQNRRDRFASELSKRLGTRASALAQWIADLSTWQRHPLPVVGAFFAPWPVTDAKEDGAAHGINLLLWRHFAEASVGTQLHDRHERAFSIEGLTLHLDRIARLQTRVEQDPLHGARVFGGAMDIRAQCGGHVHQCRSGAQPHIERRVLVRVEPRQHAS